MALWHAGIMHSMDDEVLCEPESYGIDFESTVSEIDSDCSVVVPQNKIELTEQEMAVLRQHVPDPLYDDGNSGVDLYMKVFDVISAMSN